MLLAVVGSRGLDVPLDRYMPEGVTGIVSGGARGVDAAAAAYARAHGLPLRVCYPDYDLLGSRDAPLLRNRLIAKSVDAVLAVWDGRSTGTMHTVNYAVSVGIPVLLVNVAAGTSKWLTE